MIPPTPVEILSSLRFWIGISGMVLIITYFWLNPPNIVWKIKAEVGLIRNQLTARSYAKFVNGFALPLWIGYGAGALATYAIENPDPLAVFGFAFPGLVFLSVGAGILKYMVFRFKRKSKVPGPAM